jgi:hypothetical protein
MVPGELFPPEADIMRARRVRIASSTADEGSPTDDVARERARPLVRRAATAAVLVSLGLAGLAVANLYLSLDSDEVRAWIAPRAATTLNRPVTLGDAGVSLWPRPSVRMTDIRIGNLPGFEGPALAHIETARFDVGWLPLVIGRIHVRRLVLDGARLHVAIDEHGTSNFGDLVPHSQVPAAGTQTTPLSLRIGAISVSNASLSYFDAPGARSLVVTGLEAEAELERAEEGGWRSTVATRSDSLLVRIAGVGDEIVRGAGPTAVLRVRGGLDRGQIEIEEGHVAFVEDTLAVYGALSFGGPGPLLDLLFTNEDISAAFLTALFSSDTRLDLLPRVEGRLGVMVQLHGGSGEAPAVRGSVRLDDVALRLRGEPLVDDVSGIVALTPDTVTFDALEGRFAGGPFELSGTISRAAGVAAFVARGQPDLDAFDRLGLLPDGSTLSGDASLYLSIAGASSSLDSIDVVGVAELTGLQLEHARLGAPIYVPSGAVSLVGREAHWSDVGLLVGQDRVTTSGSVEDLFDFWPGTSEPPVVEASLSALHLDLGAALPALDTASRATYAQVAIAHLGGRTIADRSPSNVAAERRLSRPTRLPLRGSVDLIVDTLVYYEHVLAGVSARIELGDSALVLPTASFEAWGGRASGALRIGIGTAHEEPFSIALSVDSVQAATFLAAMSPLGDAVTGTLDLELEVAGFLDGALLPVARELTGRIAMVVTDGEVEGTGVNMALTDFLDAEDWMALSFTEWRVDMLLQDRVLDIRDADLTGEMGEVVFSGPVRLDGSAELSMAVSIPAEHLGDVSLRRTGVGQTVLEQLRASGGSLDLGLSVGGWLQAPTLEPDASNAVALAGDEPGVR